MREYTHVIAVWFVDMMSECRKYSESERIVITYGLELLFNNSLKLIIYLIIGSIFNILAETVIIVLVLAILRLLSGGYHSQSDLGCLILTGGMIFVPIILSNYVHINHEHFTILLFGIAIVYFLYAPQDVKYLETSRKKALKAKIIVILVMFGVCASSFYISDQLGIMSMFVALVQGLSLIKGGTYGSKRKCN